MTELIVLTLKHLHTNQTQKAQKLKQNKAKRHQVEMLIEICKTNVHLQSEPHLQRALSDASAALFKYHSKALSYPLQTVMPLVMNL